MIILGNVLDFCTYCPPNQKAEDTLEPRQETLIEDFNRNNVPKEECISMMYSHGIALEFMHWIREFCIIMSPKCQVMVDLPSHYLCQQMAVLLKYKTQAAKEKVKGARHCTVNLLKKLIDNVLAWEEDLARYWINPLDSIDNTLLGFGPQDGYELCWKDGVIKLRSPTDLLQDGTTPLD